MAGTDTSSVFKNKTCFKAVHDVNLDQILVNSYDSIMVTDKAGNVLLANPAFMQLLRVEPDKMIGANVNDLVRKGYYNRSTAMEAATKRTTVTGMVTTKFGLTLMSTSMPLLDENGEVVMVVTNTRDKDLYDKYVAALQAERTKANRYQTAVAYLAEVDADNKPPVAESPAMRRVMSTVNIIAKVDSTVMLCGESGSGKEVIARYIHRHSPRAREPFIPVNCAAIPSDLMESEFFGYVRGAFTGANPTGKAGLFEIADKGTLFLDEVAELTPSLQSKLLRVLETGEIQRLGATTIHRTNVRLITATNKDLKRLVGAGQFRDDLYYRLNVIPINLPPLRDRPEDIVILAQNFLAEYNQKYSLRKHFSATTIQAFLAYEWPGNVRELRNVIERLAITSADVDELEFVLDTVGRTGAKTGPREHRVVETGFAGSLRDVLKEVEKRYIGQVLAECGGRVVEASERLGIHRTILYRKMCQIKKEM